MDKACTNYISHHVNRDDVSYQRGYQSGFFSFLRHGKAGAAKALAFNQNIQCTTSIDDAIDLINTLLTNRNTRYHTHSLASYVLDEVNALLGSELLLGHDTPSFKPDDTGHYSVEVWPQIRGKLESIIPDEGLDKSWGLS